MSFAALAGLLLCCHWVAVGTWVLLASHQPQGERIEGRVRSKEKAYDINQTDSPDVEAFCAADG